MKGTYNYGLEFVASCDLLLAGYCDSDWASSVDDRRSTSGYCFSLGSGVISWKSKKQPTVALSSIEAEYIAAKSAVCEVVWLRSLLVEIHEVQAGATMIYCDNQSCIQIAKNPVFHARTKHIKIHYHYVREKVQAKEIELVYCSTEDQAADMFTKALSRDKFEKFRNIMNVKENRLIIKGECESEK